MIGGNELPPARPPSAIASRMAGAMSLAVSALVFCPAFLASCLVAQINASFRFGAVELGTILGVFYATGIGGTWLAGRWVDRIGARVALVVACILTAVSAIGIAMSETWRGFLWMFAVCGIACGGVGPAGVRLLMSTVAPSRRGLAIAIRQSAAPLAAILTGAFAAIAQSHIGWRGTFAGFALISVAMGGLALMWGREGAHIHRAADRGRLNVDTIVLLISGAFLLGAAVSGFAGFVVTTGIAVGMSPEAAGLLLAGSSAAAIAARLLGGWAADRRSGGHLIRVALLLMLGSLACVAIGFASGPGLLIPAVVAVSVTGWSSNALYSYAIVNRQAHAPARATSIVQLGAFGGSAVGPAAFGYALEHADSRVAWTLLAFVLLMASTVVLWARRTFLRPSS